MSKSSAGHTRILLIDNYDSFTYNLVQGFAAMGADVLVHRNDVLSVSEALTLEPTHLVISPGPGRPENAGLSLQMIDAFANHIPVLGVCLGHQCLVTHFGGYIVRAERVMHGKTSSISHDDSELFAGVPEHFTAGRYHSLCVKSDTVPNELIVSAQTERGEIMAVRHRELPLAGVQFHPESILTPQGTRLMRNFAEMGLR